MQTDTALFACYILYTYFRGTRHTRIEREMRALGYARFHRRILYPRADKPGWIAKFAALAATASPAATTPRVSTPRVSTPRVSSPHGSKGSAVNTPHGSKDSPAVNTPHGSDGPLAISTPHVSEDPHCPSPPDTPPPAPDGQLPASFPEWLRAVSPGMTWSWRHQQLIIEQLERVTRGECKRLMIFLPPRHGKSELVTVRYTAWRMQRDPALSVILGGYNQRLADRFSRKIRKVIVDAESLSEPALVRAGLPQATANRQVSDLDLAADTPQSPLRTPQSSMFPFSRSRPANTVSEWETLAGGGFRAVGVGGGVTGFGAKLVVIDDPVKSRAEAESPVYRERIWDWFKDDLYTRLEPDGAVILIQTRWHEDDLAGRLLAEMHDGGEQWDVLNLPALSEPRAMRTAECEPRNEGTAEADASDLGQVGDDHAASITEIPHSAIRIPQLKDWRTEPDLPLCPDRYDLAALDRIRRRLGEYSFAALYQQRPSPAGGGVFKREWFKNILPYAPPGLRWKRGYDLAVSTKNSADYTASFRCAFDKQGNLYIAGGFRKRLEYPDQRRFVIDRIVNEPDTEHGIELALHGQALIQDLRREPGLRGRLLRGVKADSDKLTRALSWAALAEEGKVFLIRNAECGMTDRNRSDIGDAPSEIHRSSSRLPQSPNWLPDFLDELAAFPNGPHDDQIDAVSIAVQMLKQPTPTAHGF